MAEKNDDKQTNVNQSSSNSDETAASSSNEGISRRTFIKNTGLVAGGVVGGGVLGGVLGNQWFAGTDTETAGEAETEEGPANNFQEARMFFKRDEDFQVLSAAVERIFPEDDIGPGAISLAVPYFIDKQLAGEYGFNAREYMQGPFYEGASTQGNQSAILRRDIFLQGIRLIQSVANNEYNAAFFELEDDQQDEILEAFESGEPDMQGMDSANFFELLRDATLRGVYSDPLYGGNQNMDGWRMKEYPGPQMAYIHMIEDEEYQEMEPVSLHDHHK